MSVEDAILEMDMLGHTFYMFNNVESGKIRNGKSGLDIYKETVYNVSGKRISDDEALMLLKHHVSEYSIFSTEGKNGMLRYNEIIPEILSIEKTNPIKYSTEFVKLLKEACGL